MQQLVDLNPYPLVVFGQDQRVRYANPAAVEAASQHGGLGAPNGSGPEHGSNLVQLGASPIGATIGDLLGCVHTTEPGGCGGTSYCSECGAYRALTSALAGAKLDAECDIDQRSAEPEGSAEGAMRAECVKVTGLELRVQARPVEWAGASAALCILTDVSHERRRAKLEEDLARERDLLRLLMDNIPDTIYLKDTEGRFTRINKAQARMLKVAREEEALGRSDFDYFPEEHARQAHEDEMDIVRTGEPLISKIELVSGNSPQRRWMIATKVPIRDEHGAVTGILGISRDVTDWQEAVEALEESERSFRLIFGAVPHAVIVIDASSHQILAASEAATRDYGYSGLEFCGMKFEELHPEDEAEVLTAALGAPGTQKALAGAWHHRTKDGRLLDVDLGGREFEFSGRKAILMVAQDVSDRKRLDVELRHAQRMEAVGQLAAGIAHEINTPIQFVGDNLRFCLDAFSQLNELRSHYEELRAEAERGAVAADSLAKLRQAIEAADAEYLSSEVPEALKQSADGVNRVATIVRAMKEFAHPGSKEKAAADLNRSIENALVVARNEIKYVAEVDSDLGPLPPVVCNVAEMNQVFLNLIVNAAHAINEVVQTTGGKGRITVRSRHQGDHVLISISDDGCGIPQAIRERVFDPFFTTKPVGRGTGQGLTLVRSIIVDKHGGRVWFDDNETRGTTFHISLPCDPTQAAVSLNWQGGKSSAEADDDEAYFVR